ncbi:MAG TPA: amidohydrolase [Clostridia bacterium]|nr:amidohydrolase [Clostridia bacterium]
MDIKMHAKQLDDKIIAHRRWFHRHPELSFEERETTAYIVKELTRLDIEATTFSDYNGAIGTICGSNPGKTVMLRADIDALPTNEATGLPFASENPGKMHACGHDCHAAMLLGAAEILSQCRQSLFGTVKLLFQSAEESCFGARYYVEKGYMNDADALFGCHVWGSMQAPLMNIQDGYRMASCDNFKIIIHGCATHGSTPHLGHDAVMAASAIILNLQTFASRRNDPLNPLVITVGTVKGGTQFNIITDRVELEGTIRTFSRDIQPTIEPGIRKIITDTASALGCTAELVYDAIEGPVINEHIRLNSIARAAAIKLYGAKSLCDMSPVTGSEDFSVLMQKTPGVFGFLGCLNPALGIVYPNHSDKFTVDESILHRGAALYAQFAVDYLESTAKGGNA